MIMKYIEMSFEEHDLKLGKKIKENKEYKETETQFLSDLDALDIKMKLKIDEEVVGMETIAKDISYDEGFKEGVRFILGCISNGKELQEQAAASSSHI